MSDEESSTVEEPDGVYWDATQHYVNFTLFVSDVVASTHVEDGTFKHALPGCGQRRTALLCHRLLRSRW